MKSLLRSTVLFALALFLTQLGVGGVTIRGGLPTYLFAGFVLTLMSYTIRPVITLITLPINFATFGAFSMLTNALILYLLTIFVPEVNVKAFTFLGFAFAGFVVPKIMINQLPAFITVATLLSVVTSFTSWLMKH